MTVGLIEAIIDAIGEEDNTIGGLYQTRTTSAVVPSTILDAYFAWNGTSTVTTPSTSQVSVGDFIKLSEGGDPYVIESLVVDTSVTITVPSGATPPTSPSITSLGTILTWAGTTTVLASSTTGLSVGAWIRLDSDAQWFQITEVSSGVSVTISNPNSLTIPTGGTASSSSPNPTTELITTSIPVETVVGWPTSGRVTIDRNVYEYATVTTSPPSLDGITRVYRGNTIAGIRQEHRTQSTVTDISLTRTALDRLRRAMLVDYAEDADINALGRNLGVLRFPFLESDDVFRAVIKALAYNPKGTMFGLELALDALVGAGNYVIFEDLISSPNTVFITITGGPFTSGSFEGSAYLTGEEYQLPTGNTTVDIEEDIADRGAVHSVRFKDENHTSDFRTQLPSADTLVEYEGDSGSTLWTYNGPDEGVDVVLTVSGTSGGIVITDSDFSDVANYEHLARIQPDSFAKLNAVMAFDVVGTNYHATRTRQAGLFILDGNKSVGIGVVYDGADHILGFAIRTADGFVGSTQIVINEDQLYAIELRKYGQSHVELLIDGVLVATELYSSFGGTTSTSSFTFGSFSTPQTGHGMAVKQVGYFARTDTDYWSAREDTADVLNANPQQLDVDGAITFSDPDDIGKIITVANSTTANAQGGNGNGVYEVASVAASDIVELQGVTYTGSEGATVNANGNALRIQVSGQEFQFPDDLGKEIVISGSDQGNNGTYVIDTLLDPVSLVDLASGATEFPSKTSVCEVTSAAFVTESGLSYRIDPAFEDESNISWEMSAAGSVSGTTLTLRQALPLSSSYNRVLNVEYSQVLSAQVLRDNSVQNELTASSPSLVFSYYPFYLSDPLAYIQAYLDDVTAAGVIPELLET